LGFTPSKWT